MNEYQIYLNLKSLNLTDKDKWLGPFSQWIYKTHLSTFQQILEETKAFTFNSYQLKVTNKVNALYSKFWTYYTSSDY